MTKFLLLINIAIIVIPYKLYASTADTVRIYFKLNDDKTDSKAQRKLDSLLYTDIINVQTNVLIIGYADFLGTNEHNLGLSERRSKSVEDYLVSMAIPQNNIKLCIGKGEVSRQIDDPEGCAPDRRVDLVLSNIVQAGSQSKNVIGKHWEQAKKPADKSLQIINRLKVGQSFKLENIYFLMGRHVITDESLPQLDKLYNVLIENPNLKIQIEGHVCCMQHGYDAEDDDTHEARLSVNRAKYIYEYLIKKGISEDRLKYIGFGRTRPLVSPEKTSADEDMNRRVEVRIIGK